MENWRRALYGNRTGRSKYKILAQAIIADIESGVLKDGEKLPPQRDVGDTLGISVQTVTNAYKELERHGLLRCEVGRGSFVSKPSTEKVGAYLLDREELSTTDFSTARIIHSAEHDTAWRKVFSDLAAQDKPPWSYYCRPIAGLDHHRMAAAAWLQTLDVKTSPDNLLITNGATHAIFIALASLVSPGDVVLCANLTDHSVIGCSHVLGFTLKGLDMDEHGIRPDHFEDICASEKISAIVCIPNLNNPTVALMPDSRRKAIARIAERYGVHVIEDDVHGPLLERRPPPIQSYLPELTFYCTSFTKSVFCGLRIGYLVPPRRALLRADSMLRISNWMATPLMAEIASRWIEDGTAQQLVQVQRRLLASRHDMAVELLGDYLRGHHPNGLSVWVGIPSRWKLDSLVQELRLRNIAVATPDPFKVRNTVRPDALRICLGADAGDSQVHAALSGIRELFDQYPGVHSISMY